MLYSSTNCATHDDGTLLLQGIHIIPPALTTEQDYDILKQQHTKCIYRHISLSASRAHDSNILNVPIDTYISVLVHMTATYLVCNY